MPSAKSIGMLISRSTKNVRKRTVSMSDQSFDPRRKKRLANTRSAQIRKFRAIEIGIAA